MLAIDAVNRFAARGLSLFLSGDGIAVTPASALTDEDRQAIRAHKAELLALLGYADENIEMHDSALFDPPIVEVDFYDGRRIWIPQTSTPEGWQPPF
jgi:hypothetical protein